VYPVTVSICGDLLTEKAGLDPDGLVDILWAHAQREDGLEHITEHINGDVVTITLFMKSVTPENSYQSAIKIFRSALSAARPLADWKLATDNRSNGPIRISQSGDDCPSWKGDD
jgi:hypothetical protein